LLESYRVWQDSVRSRRSDVVRKSAVVEPIGGRLDGGAISKSGGHPRSNGILSWDVIRTKISDWVTGGRVNDPLTSRIVAVGGLKQRDSVIRVLSLIAHIWVRVVDGRHILEPTCRPGVPVLSTYYVRILNPINCSNRKATGGGSGPQ